MDFNFLLYKLTNNKYLKSFQDTSLDELKGIIAMREQLIMIGYNPDEVNYMISTFSDGRDLAKLDAKQLRVIEARLEEQLSIAKQCIDYISNSKQT